MIIERDPQTKQRERIRFQEKMAGKKSNFSITCSLLSQYLKEKRSSAGVGDLPKLEMGSTPQEPNKGIFRPPSTMSLFPGVDLLAETKTDTTETISDLNRNKLKSVDLFPQQTGFVEPEKKAAPLTMFYDGRVLVFDNFPAHKAKDLMQLAAKESSTAKPITYTVADPLRGMGCRSTSDSKTPSSDLAIPSELSMPIARRASLHRFFSKRKDRINSNAPYQVNGDSAGESSKPN